jgi:peptide/nickel transport system substrate-binding protein
MRVRRDRFNAATVGLVSVGLVVAACGPIEDDEPDGTAVGESGSDEASEVAEPSGDPTPGGTLTVGIEAESPGWAPWNDSFAPANLSVATAFYEPLLERDEEGVPQPLLAEAIEPNDDFTSYTLTIREGVSFHDGEPFDADAVVANLDRHRQDGSVTASSFVAVEAVEAEDESTVRIDLDQPHVAFPDALATQAGYMVSPAAIEGDDVSSSPVGTGPFVVDSWQRDQAMELSRFDDYWRDDLPYLDGLTIRPIPDEDARLQSLLSGDLDAMASLRQSTIARARDADGLNLYEHVGNNSGATILNTAVPPFDDPRVREAWAYALDPDELIAVLGGTGISPVSKGLFNPDSFWFDDQFEEAWPSEDLDRAQAAIDSYVDDPDRSDGEEPGTPVSFQFDTQPDPSLLETSSVYQAQVARIGMDMQIETVEQAVHVAEAVGEAPDFVGDYQAKIFRLGEETDPDWMVAYFAPGSPQNFTNIESEELMDTLLEARRTPDLDERRELYADAMTVFAEEVPFTLTGHTASVVATRAEVFGLDDWTLPDGTPGVGHPESVARWAEVWIDEEA